MKRRQVLMMSLALLSLARDAWSQNSSLFTQEQTAATGPTLTIEDASWLYQPVEPPRVIKERDTITIIVDEKSQVTSVANVERRKQAQLNAQLKDWVKFDGLDLIPDPQSEGDQKVNGTLQGQFRSQANLDTRDSLKFRIAASVVDILPNGHLVLEAHKRIRNNDEEWDISISGIVSPDDVLPNKTVLSEDITELMVVKNERGHVRDGYRRGWLYKLIDKYGLF